MKGYETLERIFQEHARTLKGEERKEYVEGIPERIYGVKGKVFGIQGILESAERWNISEQFLLSLPYRENLPRLSTQMTEDSCGTNTISTGMGIQFGRIITEHEVCKINAETFKKHVKEKRKGIDGCGDGLNPIDFRNLFQYLAASYLGKNPRVFTTNNGTVEQLEYFHQKGALMIINRQWGKPLDDDPHWGGNHWELCFGIDNFNDNVVLHNPSNTPDHDYDYKISGLHAVPKKDFIDWWLTIVSGKECRSYITVYPRNGPLPKDFPKGRFL
jgi:hypothetical protein